MKNEDFIFIKKMFKKRKKFKQYLKINGNVICRIKDIKVTKNKVPYVPPVFDKNSPGWNQDLQDFFKNNPPIPIADIQNQVFCGNKITRLYNENDHNTLTSLTSEISKTVNLPESFLGYDIKSKTHTVNSNTDTSVLNNYFTKLTISKINEIAKISWNDFFNQTNEEILTDITKDENHAILHWHNVTGSPRLISKKEDDESCLNNLLVMLAKHKIETNAVDEEAKKTLLNMISEWDKKVEQLKFKNMFTDIIISLDWDDVMYHLMQKNIEFVEKEYGIKDVHNEITDYYYLYRTYPKIADELWNHPENYISGELVNGAKEFYQELVNLVGEDKIQIVTSSMENVIELKDKMLKERFGINCKIVHSIFGKHKKYEFTKDTLLIDDFVGNIREHFIHNLNYGIVFNHMNLDYIKKESEEEGLLHVTTFEEVIEKVKIYLELLNNKS